MWWLWVLRCLKCESHESVQAQIGFPSCAPTRFLEAADQKAKIWVVRLLTSLLQSVCPPKVPGFSACRGGANAVCSFDLVSGFCLI